MVQNWFHRFKQGDYNITYSPHTGRQANVNHLILNKLIEDSPKSSTRQLEEQLGYFHKTIQKHLDGLGKVWKYGQFVSNYLDKN